MAIDILIGVILFVGYFLNKKKKNYLAKIFVFTLSNIIFFLFASIVPQGVGIYLIFFPLVVFYFISFDFNHRAYSFGFTFLSLLLNIMLLATNYQPFGSINLQPIDPSLSFTINLILSMVLIGIGINFLIKMNHVGENILLDQRGKLEKLTQEIQEKNTSLEKTNRELDQFVYSTSHDLKAPLASINGLLNLANLENEDIPPYTDTYLGMIKERVSTLNLFIKDILDYSRNSRLEVLPEKVKLAELINEVFSSINYLENSNKVELISETNNSLAVKIDRNRLFRILVNLVSNAIKYSDLEKKKPVATVTGSVENSKVKIMVEDNGIGIGADYKEKVFDMFYRGTEISEGSGLGLYIAREMILKMDGELEFESDLGVGSTFSISIPVT